MQNIKVSKFVLSKYNFVVPGSNTLLGLSSPSLSCRTIINPSHFLTSNQNTNSQGTFLSQKESNLIIPCKSFTVLICEQAWFPRRYLHFNGEHFNSNVSLTTKMFSRSAFEKENIPRKAWELCYNILSRKSEGPISNQATLLFLLVWLNFRQNLFRL